MGKPLVSVILLCYNQEDFVAQAIESVLAQECDFDYEIILADDASSDDTPRICRQYQHIYSDKIVLQLNDRNKGLCRNYFDCVQMAQGDYIADCAGDDFWIDSHKLQREVDAFRAHPDVSIVYSQWKVWLQNAQEFAPTEQLFTSGIYRRNDYGPATVARFLSKQFMPEIVLSASCYRKDIVLQAYREHPTVFTGAAVVAEDLTVTAALLMAGPACYLPYEHLAYRQLDESVSHSKDPGKKHRFIWDCARQSYCIAMELGLSRRSIKTFMKKNLRDELHYAYKTRNEDFAKEIYHFWRKAGYRRRPKDVIKYLLTLFLS